MKSGLVALVFLSTLAVTSHAIVHQHRQSSGWVQNPSGQASFTAYSGCQSPCKLCTDFRGFMLDRAHADSERDVLMQRVARALHPGTRLPSTYFHSEPIVVLVTLVGGASKSPLPVTHIRPATLVRWGTPLL